jgi:hypothetical protein
MAGIQPRPDRCQQHRALPREYAIPQRQRRGGNFLTSSSNGAHTHTISGATATAGESANETRAKNITVNFIIIATPAAALPTSGIGRNAERIRARDMTARARSPAGSATYDSGSNDLTIPVFDFDQTTQEYVIFEWIPPKRWDKGTVTFEALWTADAGTPAQTVIWTLAGVAISDDDVMNVAVGTAQSSADALIATGDKHRSPESAAITIAGTPANGDLVVFQLSRDVADTLAADARLIGIRLFWTSNATSDD